MMRHEDEYEDKDEDGDEDNDEDNDEDKDEDGDVPIRLGSLMLLSDQHLLSDKMRASSYQL